MLYARVTRAVPVVTGVALLSMSPVLWAGTVQLSSVPQVHLPVPAATHSLKPPAEAEVTLARQPVPKHLTQKVLVASAQHVSQAYSSTAKHTVGASSSGSTSRAGKRDVAQMHTLTPAANKMQPDQDTVQRMLAQTLTPTAATHAATALPHPVGKSVSQILHSEEPVPAQHAPLPQVEAGAVQALLVPETEAVLSSQMNGVVERIDVAEGDEFSAGEALLRFDCTMQQANLQKAVATHAAFSAEYRANKRLAKMNAISDVDLAKSEAQVRDSEAELQIKKHQVQWCQLKAPFAGVLVKRDVHAHETVRVGQPLLTLVSHKAMRVEMIVPSKWLVWLKPGQSFNLHVSETGSVYPAEVTMVLPKVDPVSQSVRVFGRLAVKNTGLMAGMSGSAQFAAAGSDASKKVKASV